MLPVEMGEHRRQGQIAVKLRFVAGLPPVGGRGDVVGNVGDGGKGVAVLRLTKLGGVVIADAVQHGLGLSVAVDVPDKAISGLAVPPVGNTGAVDRLAHIMEQTAEGGLYGLRVHEDPSFPRGRPLAGCKLFPHNQGDPGMRSVTVPLRGVSCLWREGQRRCLWRVFVPLRGVSCFVYIGVGTAVSWLLPSPCGV